MAATKPTKLRGHHLLHLGVVFFDLDKTNCAQFRKGVRPILENILKNEEQKIRITKTKDIICDSCTNPKDYCSKPADSDYVCLEKFGLVANRTYSVKYIISTLKQQERAINNFYKYHVGRVMFVMQG